MASSRNKIKSEWIDLVREEGSERNLLIDDKSEDGDIFADLIIDQSKMVKVRTSLQSKRDHSEIFYGADKEIQNLDEYSMDINTHVIDSRSGGLDLETDHFITVTEDILRAQTNKEGKASFKVIAPGTYEEPYNSNADSWDVVFEGCESIL